MPSILSLFKQRKDEPDIYNGIDPQSNLSKYDNEKADKGLTSVFETNGIDINGKTIKKEDLYGKAGTAYIDTQGIVNPPRLAALALASPTTVGGLIGSTVNNLAIKANINRPEDTIFTGPGLFDKPVSLIGGDTIIGLRNIIERGKSYYVKTDPNASEVGLVTDAIDAIQGNTVSTIPAIKAVADEVSNLLANHSYNKKVQKTQFGPKYSSSPIGKIRGKSAGETVSKYSTHYRDTSGDIKERKNTQLKVGKSIFDNQLTTINTITGSKIDDFLKNEQYKINTPYVLFKVYGEANNERSVILPGTISGLSEDVTPGINSFKYVGSPFNLYRYTGVDRSIKFNLKLYYTTSQEKEAMINKLNLLREYSFPDRNLSTISYGKDAGYSPIVFNPNILKLTINGYYNDIVCMLETLSFQIDDSTSWASMTNRIDADSGGIRYYPTVIDVTFSLKVIEQPSIKDNKYEYGSSDTNKYSNYFTGYNSKSLTYDENKVGNLFKGLMGL